MLTSLTIERKTILDEMVASRRDGRVQIAIGGLTYRQQPRYRSKAGECQKMFENLKEDWRTYGGDITRRGLWSMVVYRFGNWRYTVRSHDS